MKLYLMRHAEAAKVGGDISTDEDRTLTAYGRLQAKTVAEELKRRNVCPHIIASPYRRTKQTAEILRALLETEVHLDPLLASSGCAPDLSALLETYKSAEGLLLLGHQPDLGLLAGQLLGFEFGFGTATVIAFELRSAKNWHFLWTFSPENLGA